MTTFDPENRRRLLLGECGYRFSLASDFDEARAVGGRGSSADAFLGTAVQCLLVGLPEPARQLLDKCHEWVRAAIADREVPKRDLALIPSEPYLLDGYMAQRFRTLALCNWLRQNEHDADSLRQYVAFQDRFLSASPAGKDRTNVAMALPTYLDAGAYERAAELFAARRLAAPKSCSSVRDEGQMSFVLFRHQLGIEFTEEEARAALDKFLTRTVSTWLTNGHFVRAAGWMKIAYWQPGRAGLSASDAVLKCLDHLRQTGR